MTQKVVISIIIYLLIVSCMQQKETGKNTFNWPQQIDLPLAEIKPHLRTIHNDTVIDNYFWLNDYFKKGTDSSNVISYLQSENMYVDSMMKSTNAMQKKLFEEMKVRIKEKDESVPVYQNGYFYYKKTEIGAQYFKYCRKKETLDAQEEILLDVDMMAKGKAYFSVSSITVSDDNKYVAFGVDELSRGQYTIYIKNIATNEFMTDTIPNTQGDPCWANDNKTIYYTSKNPLTLLSEKINRHTVGSSATNDAVVYTEKDKSNYIGVYKSKNGKFILIYSQATISSEYWFLDANSPYAKFQVFQPRMKEVIYNISVLDDKFLIRTNWKAKNFRLMECALGKTSAESWKEIIPNNDNVLLSEVEEFKNFTVLKERKNGLAQLRILNNDTKNEHFIDFEEASYDVSLSSNPNFEANTIRYSYTSLITPKSIFDYDMKNKSKKLLKQQEVIGGYEKSEYLTERIYATAADGTKIPMSIVYKKGFEKNGKSPLLLYGYGSYGINIDATFSSNRLSLLDRGFAFAIAHIRGSEELGRQWYEDGKLMKKINTFTDFIACGKQLIESKYTSAAHLYAQGGSAGGLLMGAVINMAPEMWHGVIADVPFVDVVNTMLDESIPLTTNEFDEWGNPKDKNAYFYMKSYAPYENIAAKNYPNLLVTTGLHDSQVQYFEPAKWVAKLRATKTDTNVLFLKTNMEFGHGGASGRFDYLKDIALEYSFLFALENKIE